MLKEPKFGKMEFILGKQKKVTQEQPLQKPRTSTLVLCNIALWCIYFGVFVLGTSTGPILLGFVLLIPVVVVVLTVTTVPQWILHLVLKKKSRFR